MSFQNNNQVFKFDIDNSGNFSTIPFEKGFTVKPNYNNIDLNLIQGHEGSSAQIPGNVNFSINGTTPIAGGQNSAGENLKGGAPYVDYLMQVCGFDKMTTTAVSGVLESGSTTSTLVLDSNVATTADLYQGREIGIETDRGSVKLTATPSKTSFTFNETTDIHESKSGTGITSDTTTFAVLSDCPSLLVGDEIHCEGYVFVVGTAYLGGAGNVLLKSATPIPTITAGALDSKPYRVYGYRDVITTANDVTTVVGSTKTSLILSGGVASSTDDYYNGMQISVISADGSNSTQYVTIYDYIGADKIAKVSPALSITPLANKKVVIRKYVRVDTLNISNVTVQTEPVLGTGIDLTDDVIGAKLKVGSSERLIIGRTGNVPTLESAFDPVLVANDDIYEIIAPAHNTLYGVVGISPTTTSIKLGTKASSEANSYVGLTVKVYNKSTGALRGSAVITDYDESTKEITWQDAISGITANDQYIILLPTNSYAGDNIEVAGLSGILPTQSGNTDKKKCIVPYSIVGNINLVNSYLKVFHNETGYAETRKITAISVYQVGAARTVTVDMEFTSLCEQFDRFEIIDYVKILAFNNSSLLVTLNGGLKNLPTSNNFSIQTTATIVNNDASRRFTLNKLLSTPPKAGIAYTISNHTILSLGQQSPDNPLPVGAFYRYVDNDCVEVHSQLRSTCTFDFSANQPPKMSINGTCYRDYVASADMPDFDPQSYLLPKPIDYDNTRLFLVDRRCIPMSKMTLDIGATINAINEPCKKEVMRSDLKPKGELTVERQPIEELDPHARILAGYRGVVILDHVDFKVVMPDCQIIEHDDDNGDAAGRMGSKLMLNPIKPADGSAIFFVF